MRGSDGGGERDFLPLVAVVRRTYPHLAYPLRRLARSGTPHCQRSTATVRGGGFAVLKAEPCLEAGSSLILASNGSSMIANLAPGIARQGEAVITPPNSSIMFAPCAAIPTLTTELAPGEHWLACAVIASAEINKVFADMPLLIRQDRRFIIMDSQKETQQTIYF